MAKDLHELVSRIKELAVELQRTPTKRDMWDAGISDHKIRSLGGASVLTKAAGLDPPTTSPKENYQAKLLRKYKSLCAKREQIQGHFRSTLDLKEMFDRAGNPPVLKVSVQPDTHAKFVDRKAFDSYLRFLKYYEPHAHIILGDFVDCEGLSHWPQDDLEPRRIVPEMKQARGLLQELVDATPKCTTRIFLEGNHENWISQAFTKMPELFDGLAELDIEISIKSLLGLPKFGYDLFPLNEIVQIGKAHFTHGLYTATHHAKSHLDKLKVNIFYGHLHDTQETNQTSMDGNIEASSLGCLARLDAKFLKGKPNNWVHAHGVFEFFPDGSFNWYKVKILNGRSTFNGRVF